MIPKTSAMSASRALGMALRLPRLSSNASSLHTTPSPLNVARRLTPLRTGTLQRQAIGIRYSSTAQTVANDSRSLVTRLKNIFYGTSIALFLLLGFNAATDVRFSLHQYIAVPLLRYIYDDAEEAHAAGTAALKNLHALGMHFRERGNPDAAGDLQVEVFGHTLSNPIGTSAGIDKRGEVPDELLMLGGAYVEVGGVTPLPQEGNPKPRLFRVPSQAGLINRFGLNSEGADHVAMRLRKRVREYAYAMGYGSDEAAERLVLDGEAGVPPGSLVPGKIMAVQVAKNKSTPDDVGAIERDYVYCVERLSKYADVIVVNVSSPNTENLRDLQKQEPLTRILKGVVGAAKRTDRKTKPAVMVKVSPDEDSQEQVEGICEAIWESGVDGVIVGNTTTRRPAPLPEGTILPPTEAEIMKEKGGYSGPQLFERTVSLVKKYSKTLNGNLDTRSIAAASNPDTGVVTSLPTEQARKVIFCSGGITNGKQALEALNAGADMVQIYTALVYGGVGTIARIKDEMRQELAKKP